SSSSSSSFPSARSRSRGTRCRAGRACRSPTMRRSGRTRRRCPVTEPQLDSHSYDGIQEYDNPTPSWWTWIFLVTVAFSGLYMFVAILSNGAISAETSYQYDFTESLKQQYGQLGDVKAEEATLVRLAQDEKWLRVGQSLFQ